MSAAEIAEPTEYRLSKRQQNVLSDTFNGLTVVEQSEEYPLERRAIFDLLADFSYLDTFASSGTTNVDRPKVIDAMIGKDSRRHNYLAGLAAGDELKLLEAATEAANHQGKALVFRMVYGASEEASVRSIGYVLPALQAIGQLRHLGLDLGLQIVFSRHISAEINGLDAGETETEFEAIQTAVLGLAKFLGLEDYVGFYDDAEVADKEVEVAADAFLEGSNPASLLLLQQKGETADEWKTALYAGAHHVIHDAAVDLNHTDGLRINENSSAVIDVGGKQERFFRAAREVVASATGLAIVSPQLYTRHHIPPYYMAKGGDLGLTGFLEGGDLPEDISRSVRMDIDYIGRTTGLSLGEIREVCSGDEV